MKSLTTVQTEFTFSPALLSDFAAVKDDYRYAIKSFISFAADATGENAFQIIRDYYKSLNQSGLSASTIRIRRQAVKSRLRLAVAGPEHSEEERTILEHELRLIDNTPGLKCPTAAPPDGTGKTLSDAEYRLLLKSARSDRQRRFIEFLAATGCRVSELTGVLLTDCKIEGGYVVIAVRGKGNRKADFKERRVFISSPMYDRIIETFDGQKYLFETSGGKRYSRSYISDQIGQLTLTVLGRRLSAHKLRHTCITRLLREGKPIDAVSRYAGHSSIQITARYSHNHLQPEDVLGFGI